LVVEVRHSYGGAGRGTRGTRRGVAVARAVRHSYGGAGRGTPHRARDCKRLNPAWEATIGFTPSELIAEPYLAFVHPEDRAATLTASSSSAAGNRQVAFENRFRCKDGSYHWLSWSFTPVSEHGLIYAVARDITECKRAEQEQQRLYRVTEGLRDILVVINSSRALNDILSFIIAHATRLLDVAAGQIYRLERSSGEQDDTLYVEASHGFAVNYAGAILKNAPLTVSYQAIQRAAPIAAPDMASVLERLLAQPTFGRGQQPLVTEIRQRFRAMLAVPLMISGAVYGTISLYSEDPRRFNDEEVQLAMAFTAQAALAIENARLREQVERAAVLEERAAQVGGRVTITSAPGQGTTVRIVTPCVPSNEGAQQYWISS